MKKRLRKKKRVGEFKELGVPIALKLANNIDFDSFLDEFLEEAIEANGCYFGGGGKKERFSGFIELGRKADLPEERLKKITDWLNARQDVTKTIIGTITDVWHGPFDEMDSIEDNL